MYERFTDRARKVMQLSNQEAQRFNHEYIGTEHVLLGLIKEGSGVAANMVAARPDTVAGMLLVTPFASLGAVAQHHMPFLPVALLLRDRFDTLDLLTNFEGPMVIVTGSDDTIVPEQLALPLQAAHRGKLLHWSQPGAGHNTIDVDPRAEGWREIDAFLAAQLSAQGL